MRKGRIERRGSLNALEERIAYTFRDRDYLDQALDLSRVSAQEGRRYDRLEKFGDRLLYVTLLDLVERRYPEAPLCEVTRMERVLTTNLNLAHLAMRLDLMAVMLHRYPGFIYQEKTLADLFEAVCAAVARDAGGGDCLRGLPELRRVCERLFALDLSLVQVHDPWKLFSGEACRRWGRSPRHEWKSIYYQGQPIGYTCKIYVPRNANKLFGIHKEKPSIVGTGVTVDQALRNAAGIALLKMLPKRFPNNLPSLTHFSWRIKADRNSQEHATTGVLKFREAE